MEPKMSKFALLVEDSFDELFVTEIYLKKEIASELQTLLEGVKLSLRPEKSVLIVVIKSVVTWE